MFLGKFCNVVLVTTGGTARGRLRNALIADSDDFAPIMGGGRFQLQTEDQESGTTCTHFTYSVM